MSHTRICTQMFTAVLLMKVRNWAVMVMAGQWMNTLSTEEHASAQR